MGACSVEVIKLIGKYLNTPVGTVCYNTDKVLTTVLDKQNVEGFASIVLYLAEKAKYQVSNEQIPLSYQWLEHISMYANQAFGNPTFAKTFLEEFDSALEKNTYLTGQFLSIADVAAYYVLYPLMERLTLSEKESVLHLCRWMKHIQAQPRDAFSKRNFFKFLPQQVYPQELRNVSLDEPVLFHPQPFSYPGYPVILYL